MKIFKFIALLVVIFSIIVFLCSNFMKNSIDYYQDKNPEMNIKEYFNGPIKAWGVVQDWRGRVVRQFDIKMIGSWDGDIGTLKEHFNYYDGQQQERIWTIEKLDNGQYEGTASDIIDKALGKEKGSAAQWSYLMDLEVDKKIFRIRFDDWMWLMNDGVLINRSYLKKFGITVAELTIFMKKD
jgi:hypothetical protein